MNLNLAKCSFGVQACNFFGFMLTKRGIEANKDKFQAIIDMRSPSNVKQIQQLTRRLAVLSHFISCAGDKAFHFFTTLNKNERFEWTNECEQEFLRLKVFLA